MAELENRLQQFFAELIIMVDFLHLSDERNYALLLSLVPASPCFGRLLVLVGVATLVSCNRC